MLSPHSETLCHTFRSAPSLRPRWLEAHFTSCDQVQWQRFTILKPHSRDGCIHPTSSGWGSGMHTSWLGWRFQRLTCSDLFQLAASTSLPSSLTFRLVTLNSITDWPTVTSAQPSAECASTFQSELDYKWPILSSTPPFPRIFNAHPKVMHPLSEFRVMLLNCGAGEGSWESLGLQGDQTSQS